MLCGVGNLDAKPFEDAYETSNASLSKDNKFCVVKVLLNFMCRSGIELPYKFRN